MALLPFERYELTSALNFAQIEQQCVNKKPDDEYIAAVNNKLVTIKASTRFKVGGYTRSFKPQAVISINETLSGTQLSVFIKPKGSAVAILVLVVTMLLAGVWYSQRTKLGLGNYKDALIAGAGVVIMAYLLPITAFNANLDKIKLFINDLFQVDQNQ